MKLAPAGQSLSYRQVRLPDSNRAHGAFELK